MAAQMRVDDIGDKRSQDHKTLLCNIRFFGFIGVLLFENLLELLLIVHMKSLRRDSDLATKLLSRHLFLHCWLL